MRERRYDKELGYWHTGDEEWPFQDDLGMFKWKTLRNGVKIRLHDGYSVNENFTMYNASVRIQHMVDTYPRKFRPYGTYEFEDGMNYYSFEVNEKRKVSFTRVFIVIEDDAHE